MAFSWWEIPGPSEFVRRLRNHLRDRVNVVAALPTGVGADWFDYFRRQCERDQFRLDFVPVRNDGKAPLATLCEAFSTKPDGALSISALAVEDGFRGRTLALLLRNGGPVTAWVDFVVAYERECRGIDEMERAVFLLVLDGVSPRSFPKAETCLRVHVYDGYVRPHDCYMYSWVLLGAEEKQPWRTELKMSLCAQLAQWDARFCEVLSEKSLADIMRKETARAAFDTGGEDVAGEDPDELWARGIVQRRDGEVVYHSGWLARDERSQEFGRRIWTAQLQVVFPLIERVRHQVLEEYGGRIALPVCLADGATITDLYALELAMVRALLYRAGGVPRNVMRRLDEALAFRNALAHLEPLGADRLLQFDPALRR